MQPTLPHPTTAARTERGYVYHSVGLAAALLHLRCVAQCLCPLRARHLLYDTQPLKETFNIGPTHAENWPEGPELGQDSPS